MDSAQFLDQYRTFTAQAFSGELRLPVPWPEIMPCLQDDTPQTDFDRHYVYHPAWAARVLSENRPERHTDISSTLHFSSLVSAFIPVDFYDYRPADLTLDNLTSGWADLTNLHFEDQSLRSLSCMHTVEHIGLGRYGDPLDPDADLKAMAELQRVLAPNGFLMFVVPVGRPRVMFNAHRIYGARQIVDYFPELELVEFALIPEDGQPAGLLRDVSPESATGQEYGCGCFLFRRPAVGRTEEPRA